MTEPGDEFRARLRRVEENAAAARHLAPGADRDVAEVRVELREFRGEVRAEFAGVRSEVRTFRDQNNRVLSAMREDVVEGFRRVDDRFTEIRGLLDGQAAWNQQLAGLLGVLIRRQDEDQ